jgi:hypothetical protein
MTGRISQNGGEMILGPGTSLLALPLRVLPDVHNDTQADIVICRPDVLVCSSHEDYYRS